MKHSQLNLIDSVLTQKPLEAKTIFTKLNNLENHNQLQEDSKETEEKKDTTQSEELLELKADSDYELLEYLVSMVDDCSDQSLDILKLSMEY